MNNDKIIHIDSVNDLVDIVFGICKIRPVDKSNNKQGVTYCVYDKHKKVYRVGVI